MINPELSFKSFIFTIAHNLVISEYRKQINRPELIDYIEFTNNSNLIDDSTQHKIDLFELIKEHGMTSTQVAEQLGISEQVVRNQLSVSLKTLKKALNDSLILFLLFFSN